MSRLMEKVVRPLRRYLLEGIIVMAPVGLTAIVLIWLFQQLDGILGRYLYPHLDRALPGLGLALLLVVLVITGWVTERALGRRLVQQWDDVVRRLPVARRIYNATSKIVRTVMGEERMAFRKVVLFEYPSDGRWAIGFVTGPGPSPAEERFGEAAVTVYMPTAPNPMSGYLAVVPESQLITLDISVEEAFTYVVSVGAVSTERAASVLAGIGAEPSGSGPATEEGGGAER